MRHYLRKRGVSEEYVTTSSEICIRTAKISVITTVGETEEIEIEAGLHQGSILSPYPFILILDDIAEGIQKYRPWAMLFADSLVVCDENRQRTEEKLKRWRSLDNAGLKVSRSNRTPANLQPIKMNQSEGERSTNLLLVAAFKYLDSTIKQKEGEGVWCEKEVAKRIEMA